MIRVFNQYISPKSIVLMALEGLLIIASLWSAAKFRFWADPLAFSAYVDAPGFLLQALTVVLVLEICFYYNDLYDLNSVQVRTDQMIHIGQALGSGCILLGSIYFLIPGLLVGRGVLFIAIVLVLTTVTVTRIGLDRVWRMTAEQNILILGDGNLALTVSHELSRRLDLRLRLVGFVMPGVSSSTDLFGHKVWGAVDRLTDIVSEQRISKVVVALEDSRGALPTRDLVRLKVQGIQIEDAHTMLAALTGRIWLRAVRPSWFVYSGGFRRSATTALLKRALDLSLGICASIRFGRDCDPLGFERTGFLSTDTSGQGRSPV